MFSLIVKKSKVRILLVGVTFVVMSKVSLGQFKYWVEFKDKGTAYKNIPVQSFLSERAMERRRLRNVSVDEKDYPVNPLYISQLLSKGFNVTSKSKWLNGVVVESMEQINIAEIGALDFIRKIKPFDQQKTTSTIVKFEPLQDPEMGYAAGKTNFFPAEYGSAYEQINLIKTNILHEYGYTGEGVLIAVFDGGFRNVDTLEAFRYMYENNRMVYAQNMVEDSLDVYRYSGHGTSVLSQMGAFLKGEFIGTAPDASYALFVTENVSSETPQEEINWAMAAEIADSIGVDIINSSLGYSTFDDPQDNYTYDDLDGNTAIITKAADIAASRGILVVTSAGNEGNGSWKYITAPGDADSILTVGATNVEGSYAPFSSIGPTADGRLKPNVSTPGWNNYIVSDQGDIKKSSGTSFASPMLAGSAACLWQTKPDAISNDILRVIEESASQFEFSDVYLGYGIPDFSKAYEMLNPEDTIPIPNDWMVAFPNPFNEEFYIRYFSTRPQIVNIEIYDRLARCVMTLEQDLYYGFNEISIELPSGETSIDVTNGIYFLKLTNDNQEVILNKVLKMN